MQLSHIQQSKGNTVSANANHTGHNFWIHDSMKVEILVLRTQILTISSVILFRSYKINANFGKQRKKSILSLRPAGAAYGDSSQSGYLAGPHLRRTQNQKYLEL